MLPTIHSSERLKAWVPWFIVVVALAPIMCGRGGILRAVRQAFWTHVTVSITKYVSFPGPMKHPIVSAVMPCLNEERTLPACIRKAQACFRELGIEGEVVIADNGSTDRSVEVARSLGARVVHQPIKGYGAA